VPKIIKLTNILYVFWSNHFWKKEKYIIDSQSKNVVYHGWASRENILVYLNANVALSFPIELQ